MTKMKLALLASAAVIGSSAMADTASAQTSLIYSGGSTLASKVYRYMMDCYGVPVTPSTLSINTACSSSTGDASGLNLQILYAPVGSGGGKRGFVNNNGSNSTSAGLGTVNTLNTVPYTSTLFTSYSSGYPALEFVGSDDPIVSADLATFNGNSSVVANAGGVVQIPAFVVPVVIAVNGKDGNGNALNIQNSTPTGGSSGLNLSRQALCGIVSGHITQWNNSILTALNNNTQLGTGNITWVHRSDGSGTTFIVSNALIAQCAGVTGPNSETDSTTVVYNFPWTDGKAANVANIGNSGLCYTVGSTRVSQIPVEGSNTINWPDVGSDECGVAIPNPNGAHFANASQSAGVTNLIQSTNGAIGYIPPDFAQPISSTGPIAANLQNEWSVVTGTANFLPPTQAGANSWLSETHPPAFDASNIKSPFTWTLTINANPAAQTSYPLAGWTYLDFYECYTANTYTNLLSYLEFVYGPTGGNIQTNQGFGPIGAYGSGVGSAEWLNFIGYIVTNYMSSAGNLGCASHAGIN
jgi:ABC-type phosphate transport system substrate-binding protein